MADKKISALTSATTPLAGTEVLPIVQSGATVKVAVSDLTAGRAISATAVTASTGNFIVGTSGQGVDFSATPGTGTSELFADYEEGTWTPVLSRTTGGAITASTSDVTAKYTKIGRQVTINLSLTIDSVTSQGTGANYISGLPYLPVTNFGSAGPLFRNSAFLVSVVMSCNSWSDGKLYFHDVLNTLNTTDANWQAGYLNLSYSYFVYSNSYWKKFMTSIDFFFTAFFMLSLFAK